MNETATAVLDTPPTITHHPRFRVMFLHTSAVIGGAETLMLDLIRRLDRQRFLPELCCLKSLGPIGETLADEIPTFTGLLNHKYDLAVLPRLTRLLRKRQVDAIICVGAGDKMFWGQLAAMVANVPVVICAIHSTGWPDRIGRLNRMLTPLTDVFVGVADAHGRYLRDIERFPASKVSVIPNGVDTDTFRPRTVNAELRRSMGLKPGPVAGTVARLSEEKNINLFLDVAARTRRAVADAQFVIVGDGVQRAILEARAKELGIADCVRFVGFRSDIPAMLGLMDLFLLTSHIEANPVSILEALASGVPVVSTRVGSVPETVTDDVGRLVAPGDAEAMSRHVVELFQQPERAKALGATGRETVIRRWGVERMVRQYENLIEGIYMRKHGAKRREQ